MVNMQTILGFAKCRVSQSAVKITLGKVYPYYKKLDCHGIDYKISIIDDDGNFIDVWMFMECKPANAHWLDFYYPPEFPKRISKWTEDDWFNFSLKYGG